MKINTSRSASSEFLPMLCITLGQTFWGFSNMFTKTALSVADNYVLLSVRFVLAMFLISLPLLTGLRKIRLKGRPIRYLAAFSILEAVYFFLESYAIDKTNATFAGVVLSLTPIISTAFAAIFIHEYPTLKQLIFCFFPVVGIILITLSGSSLGFVNVLGVIALFLCCITAAAMRVVNRRASLFFSTYERTVGLLLLSSIAFTVMALFRHHGDISVYRKALTTPRFILPVLVLVIFCSILSNVFVNYAAANLSVVKISMFSSVSTIVAMFSGVIFLHEPMTVMMLIGSALILLGLFQVNQPAPPQDGEDVDC